MPLQFNTAYQEALTKLNSEEFEEDSRIPSYMVASDTLNIANRNMTFLESASDTLESVPKFIGLSIISGINQLYNVPSDLGNLFGGDFARSDTGDVIEALDSDLGAFYKEHQEGIDLVGFIASSIVPGIAGVKILNAGQIGLRAAIAEGKLGNGLAKSFGLLLTPQKKATIAKAVSEVINSNSAPSLLNTEALKAMTAGFGQNILEGAAFEVAIAVTLFNSPILEAQEFGDLIANVAVGAGLFGLVGGVVDATVLSFALKKAKKVSDIEARPWTSIAETSKASESYESIALDFQQLHDIPAIPNNVSAERKIFLTNAAQTKRNKLELNIRDEIGTLSNGDQDVAQVIFEAFKRTALADQQGAFIGLMESTRFADAPKLEKRLNSLQKKISSGKATINEIDLYANTARSYAKMWGEDVGKVSQEIPVITSIVDLLKKGQKIIVDARGVTAGERKWDFSTDYNLKINPKKKIIPWNILAADPFESDARYIWASQLKPFKPTASKPITILETDIPLLEKVIRDVEPSELNFVNIISEDGFINKASSFNLLDKVTEVKNSLGVRLHNATAEGLIGSDTSVVAHKLLSLLGIRFTVENLSPGTLAQAVRKVGGENAGFSKIAVSREALTTEPLHKLVSTILHEEGHLKFDTILDIGGIPKADFPAIKEELIAASKIARAEAWEGAKEGSDFFLYLNDTHELMADTFSYFSQYPGRMAIEAPTFERLFGHLVRPLPQELVDSYAKRMTMLTQDEIASMINVKSSYLSGEHVKTDTGKAAIEDIFARQDHAEKYTKQLINQGSRKDVDGLVDIWNIPQHVKFTYDTTPFKEINGHVIENMVIIKQQQKLYQEATSRSSAGVLKEFYEQLPDITSGQVYGQANSSGAGAGFASAASHNYGSLAATSEFVGSVTSRAIKAFQDRAREVLDPALYKLANNQEATIEWSVLNSKLRSIEEIYGLNPAGDALEPIKMLRWKEESELAVAAEKAAPTAPTLLQADTPLRIEIANQEVRDLARIHIELNGIRTEGHSSIRSAQGARYQRDPASFYPIPIDPKDFPFFAVVTDDSITSIGHAKTLYATNADDLAEQINKLKQNPHLTIRTKKDAEDYYKSIGQWDYEKTLNDNYLDITAHRNGVSAPFVTATDPGKVTSDMLNWHMQRETGLVREAISAKYEVQFEELRRLGDSYTNIATSKFSNLSIVRFADDAIKNPFADYVKTALAIKKNSDYPWWVNPNRMADEAASRFYRKLTGAVETAKTEAELLSLNNMLEKAGYKGAHYDASMEIFANAQAERGVLTGAVQKANSILATVVLRLDALNAVNNAVSANVLLGAETKAVIGAISRGDEEAVGALAALTRVNIPGTGETIFTAKRLIANAMLKFNRSSADMQFYKDIGVVTSISDQYRTTLDALTYTGKDVKGWNSRINGVQKDLAKLANTGEKWTGNRLAEEFNRFIAADVMKQMTDVAVSRGLMSSKEQLAYINTFVNRTQGNYLAAQRPMMFQGPVGQAIGLFQTYQFNLMQQLLRHVGEGHAKDSMTLLALQGTIHGMNGLPAFNAINTHIIGTASGNTEHRDAYNAVYGIAGKEAGDWLMYGLASNALGLIDPDLKINLYTRGDINPRHVTIVPTDPSSVPVIQATGKVFRNLFTTAGKLAAGGDVTTTLLQGLEYNGISRPLAGLAQTLEGLANPLKASYSTSRRGNVIASNDFLSLANLGRVVGGKPLDEAIALDATYRYKAYALTDSKRRAVLGQAIKTTMIAGQNPTQDQIEEFIEGYVAAGGRHEEFNKWFTQLYRTANLSQANKIQQNLKSPFSQSMQRIMGGRELRDFTE